MTADQDFATLAYESILKLACEKHEFIVDDLVEVMGEFAYAQGDARPLFRRAENLKIIERTDTFIRSRRKKQHGQPHRVWRSRIFQPAATGELVTECCLRRIAADERFCPRCGWEARVQGAECA